MVGKNIVEKVRRFVEEECKRNVNKQGWEIYVNHLVPMYDYSVKIAKGVGADVEIVRLAAWLHDIGSIVYKRENHHITGAEIAEKKLNELNYPIDKIEQVKYCILNHRGSQENNRETIESKVIADADAIPCFDHIEGQFLWVIDSEGKKIQKEIRNSVRRKYENCWSKLSFPESKELVKDKYEAAMLLLK